MIMVMEYSGGAWNNKNDSGFEPEPNGILFVSFILLCWKYIIFEVKLSEPLMELMK